MKLTVILFLDMDAAFSSASIQGITKILKKQEVEPELVRWSETCSGIGEQQQPYTMKQLL